MISKSKPIALFILALSAAILFQNCSGSSSNPSSLATSSTALPVASASDSQVAAPAALVISPATVTLEALTSIQFQVKGGTPPYKFTLGGDASGSLSASGAYIAPTTAALDQVTVSDNGGLSATSTVTTLASDTMISSASTTPPFQGAWAYHYGNYTTPSYTDPTIYGVPRCPAPDPTGMKCTTDGGHCFVVAGVYYGPYNNNYVAYRCDPK